MAFSIVLPLFFLLSLTLAQFSVPPPAGTPTAALPIYTNNANFETKWDSGYSNMGLVLYNNYVMEDGTQSIIRLIRKHLHRHQPPHKHSRSNIRQPTNPQTPAAGAALSKTSTYPKAAPSTWKSSNSTAPAKKQATA